MQRRAGVKSFSIACLTGWLVLSLAGIVYARQMHFPAWAAAPVLAAFLVEYVFYLVPGFESVRDALIERFSPRQLAPLLLISALLPYSVYAAATGVFHLSLFLTLAAFAAVTGYWFLLLPRSAAADIGFLIWLVAFYIAKVLKRIYLGPVPHMQTDALGHMMIVRFGLSALLLIRRFPNLQFGFWPSRTEWLTGLRFFAWFLPFGIPLGWWLGFVTFRGVAGTRWVAPGVFLGTLWVLALSEEFLFRGILQPWITRAAGNRWAGLVLTSICFGLCHLWLRGFPNWRAAAFATLFGLFLGQAFRVSGVRASMVCHALVVTLWLVWLN